MNIAIRNPHRLGIAGQHSFHDYILKLLQSGAISHIFIDDLSFREESLARIYSRYNWKELGLDSIKIIFSAKRLNEECDILLSFDSGLNDFTPAVKNFTGIKIFHIMDYFWGEPFSIKVDRLREYKIDYLFSYGSPDRYCDYFKKNAPDYIGRVIPLPFGYGERFKQTRPFAQRLHKCVAMGSVRPLRFANESKEKYLEQANFYKDEAWFHKFRRMLVEHKESLQTVMDSMLPEFPHYRDYDYDMVEKCNEYQLFISDESLFYFPSAKSFEGPACGTVMVCSDNQCFRDFGFIDQKNCITHREFDITDCKKVITDALLDQDRLEKISIEGREFVETHYSHTAIAHSLAHILRQVAQAHVEGIPITDVGAIAYDQYTNRINRLSYPVTLSFTNRSLNKVLYSVSGFFYYVMMLAINTARKIHTKLYVVLRRIWKRILVIRNEPGLSEKFARKRAARLIVPKILSNPSEKENKFISELRADSKALPIGNTTTAPERKWLSFAKEVQQRIADSDPRTFLSWDVIRYNMLYGANERDFQDLAAQNDWNRWEKAIIEPTITNQQPFYLFPKANENTIRQATHLLHYMKMTGRRPETFDTIIDFGGGFGSMCRLVHALGFGGTYIIFDWPIFSLLQQFYLRIINSKVPIIRNPGKYVPGILLVNELEQLEKILADAPGEKLLIATWSLSETSPAFRNDLLDIVKPDSVLITYQKEFGGVQNKEYFDKYIHQRNDLEWSLLPMHYLPSEKNKYLTAVRKSAQQ